MVQVLFSVHPTDISPFFLVYKSFLLKNHHPAQERSPFLLKHAALNPGHSIPLLTGTGLEKILCMTKKDVTEICQADFRVRISCSKTNQQSRNYSILLNLVGM